MEKIIKICFDIVGIFAGMAAGSWVINKSHEELVKVFDYQEKRKKTIEEMEEED